MCRCLPSTLGLEVLHGSYPWAAIEEDMLLIRLVQGGCAQCGLLLDHLVSFSQEREIPIENLLTMCPALARVGYR
jgi:hypothetical protein